MKRRVVLLSVAAALAASVAGLWALARFGAHESLPDMPGDQAPAFYTRAHSGAYGGIDRWASYGMRVETVNSLLTKAGYQCQLPPERSDLQTMRCHRLAAWPQRTLTIEARIDYRLRGRLVAATAHHTMAGPWGQRVGSWLSAHGWIEPQSLQVRGFEFDSVDLLGLFAADTLRKGAWHERCGDELAASDCPALAQERRAHGFPALPDGALDVGSALEVINLLERVRLLPVAVRGADNQPEDSLLVRVEEGRMWLDFAGRDLSGRTAKVAVALDSVGGAATELVVELGADSRSLKLDGVAKNDNGGTKMFLLPQASDNMPTFAHWLTMPNEHYPGTFAKFGPALAHTHPAFFASTLQAVLGKTFQAERPEDKLALYPLLHSMEERAALLRQANIASWMPDGVGEQMMLEAYPGQPAARVAWALAMCPPDGQRACLQRLARTDPEAYAILRQEVTTLSSLYATLAVDNPLRVHLRQLADAL
jgi:hypothetical protein